MNYSLYCYTYAFISSISMIDILENIINDLIKWVREKCLRKKILAYKERLKWKTDQESSNMNE